jgi:hypothetical protein
VKRVALVCLTAVLLIGSDGCTSSGANTPARPSIGASPTLAPAELTPGQPTGHFQIRRRPDAHVVHVRLLSNNNPKLQGLVLNVSIHTQDMDTRRSIQLGQVSPFPSDRPGEFVPILPKRAADLLHDSDAVLVVTLASALN